MSANNTGVLRIEYEEVSKVVNDSDNDWVKFIKDDSDGLTKTGQVLLQSAIESYVYSVLGAQAQTRWPVLDKVRNRYKHSKYFIGSFKIR